MSFLHLTPDLAKSLAQDRRPYSYQVVGNTAYIWFCYVGNMYEIQVSDTYSSCFVDNYTTHDGFDRNIRNVSWQQAMAAFRKRTKKTVNYLSNQFLPGHRSIHGSILLQEKENPSYGVEPSHFEKEKPDTSFLATVKRMLAEKVGR